MNYLFKRILIINSINIKVLNYSKRTMTRKALIFLAEGAEETETIITVDSLRRANIDVCLVGLNNADTVTCALKTKIVPDTDLNSVKNDTYDAVIVPGGPGAEICASVSV